MTLGDCPEVTHAWKTIKDFCSYCSLLSKAYTYLRSALRYKKVVSVNKLNSLFSQDVMRGAHWSCIYLNAGGSGTTKHKKITSVNKRNSLFNQDAMRVSDWLSYYEPVIELALKAANN